MDEQGKSAQIREALRDVCVQEAGKRQPGELAGPKPANPERADNGCMIFRGLKS